MCGTVGRGAQSGVLRSRGGPLERAAARVCREAGARVTTHTRLADLNIPHVQHLDDRRIEVIANGLALWGGAQLAVDTTLVSPLTRAGEPGRRAGRYAASCRFQFQSQSQRTSLPRTPSQFQVPPCRFRNRSGRPLERGSRLFHHQPRPSQNTPALLRQAAIASLISRWTAFLTHAALTAFAAALIFEDPTPHHNLEGEPATLSDLLAQLPLTPQTPAASPPTPPDLPMDFAFGLCTSGDWPI